MPDTIIITDTSCLILLDKIDALDLLHILYREVYTTAEIANEYGDQLPSWIKVVSVKSQLTISKYARQVDLGEASAIALSYELHNPLLILDDSKGRRLATELKLRFTGTIGVLINARSTNKIFSLRPYFEQVKSTNFRIDHNLLDRILKDFND